MALYDDDIIEYNGDDNEESVLFKALRVGAVAAGAALLLGRTGGMERLSRGAHVLGGTMRDAATSFSSERTMLSRLWNPKTDILDSLVSHTRNAYSENLSKVSSNAAYSGTTYAELYARNAMAFSSEFIAGTKKEFSSDYILSGIKGNVDDDSFLSLHNFFSSKYEHDTTTPDELVARLRKEFNLGDDTINHIVTKVPTAFSPDYQNMQWANVQNSVQDRVIEAIRQESKNILGTSDTVGKSVWTGYKRATLDEYVKAIDSGKVVVSEQNQKAVEFLRKMIETSDDYKKLIVDKGLYVDKAGDIVDMRVIPSSIREFAKSSSNTLPAKVFHAIDFLSLRDDRMFQMFHRGDVAPYTSRLISKDGIRLKAPLLHIGTGIYEFSNLNRPVATGYRLSSSRYGTTARATKRIFGLSADRQRRLGPFDIKDGTLLSNIMDTFDIGKQESSSAFDEARGMFSKFDNPNWDRNIINRAFKGNATKNDYEDIASFLDKNTSPMSQRVWENIINVLELEGYRGHELQKLRMRNADEIEKAVLYFNTQKGSNAVSNDRLRWYLRQYSKDPMGFLSRNVPVSNKVPSDLFRNVKSITGYDVAKREMQKEILSVAKGKNFEKMIRSLRDSGRITTSEMRQALDLLSFSNFDSDFFALKTASAISRDKGMNNLKTLFSSDDTFRESITRMRDAYAGPMQTIAFDDESKDLVNTRYMSVKKSSAWKGIKNLKDINSATKARAFASDIIKESFAGRKRPEDITPFTMYGYFFAERTNELLSGLGLAFSDKSMGSAASQWGNIFLKRILPVYGAYMGANYLDYETENLTGEGLYSRLYGGYAATRLLGARIGDTFGMHSLYKSMYSISPQLQYLDENGPMTEDELREYYQNGYDPIRKGRFWGMGSSTPWRGENIEYWRPSMYRMIKSNYKYTDVLYGSKEEYWANAPIPTPRHPFAPIKHFITDRYHFENKHYEDRPYPVSGDLFESSTPWGVILNPTIGSIIKPSVEMHRGEWKEPTTLTGMINKWIKEKAHEKEAVAMRFPVAVSTNAGGLNPGWIVPNAVAQPGFAVQSTQFVITGDGAELYPSSDLSNFVSGGPFVAGTKTSGVVVSQGVSASNFAIKARALEKSSAGTVPSTLLDASIYTTRSKYILDEDNKLELTSPAALPGRLGELGYTMREVGGIFGFMTETMLDNGIVKQGNILQRASDMTSSSRAFWDESLGGVGGNLSEFFRRFLPKRWNEYQPYNPIRNTMPTWLPGDSYFINFRAGDPYAKIKQGEARLPGGGYEALNQIHPDMFGRYGAFDRMKILADVAPYSEEYRIWKSVASQTITDPELRKEMQAIKKRVSKQKKRHDFSPYKFRYSDTEWQTVTVAKILDANTFMSHEIPDTPIRLAGVKLTKENGGLDTVLNVGETVKVEYAKDRARRFNRDTYGTLNAVIHRNGQNLNSELIDSGQGTEKEGDDSPAGVVARFSATERLLGRTMEFIGHMDNPISNKLLRIRSPYEEYRRTEVYGKPYQTWSNPIESYISPTIEAAWGHGSMEWPILGTIQGAWTTGLAGYLIGSVFAGGRGRAGAKIGAVVGGIGALATGIAGMFGYTYIPDRVRKRREIEEYFDALTYLKYRALYQRSKELAREYEGARVEDEIGELRGKGSIRKIIRSYHENLKRKAYVMASASNIEDDEARKEFIKQQNQAIESLRIAKTARIAGKYTMSALMYRQKMESTLIGLSDDAPWVNVFRALPKREREYMAEFIEAPSEERNNILKLVPENQKKILLQAWGMDKDEPSRLSRFLYSKLDKDEKQALSEIGKISARHEEAKEENRQDRDRMSRLRRVFSKFTLPGTDWQGWRPDVNLQDIKIKVMDHYGVDIADAGHTRQDLQMARQSAPPAFDIYQMNAFVTSRIYDVLNNAGFSDVSVIATPTGDSGLSVSIDMANRTAGNIVNAVRSLMN